MKMKGVRMKLLPLLLLACIVSTAAQGQSGVTACDTNNGGCSEICAIDSLGDTICSCQDGSIASGPNCIFPPSPIIVIIFIFYCPIIIIFFPLAQLSIDQIDGIARAETAAELLIIQRVRINNLADPANPINPANVEVNVRGNDPFEAEVRVSFNLATSPLEQALISQAINVVLTSTELSNTIADAMGLDRTAVSIGAVFINVQCGALGARNISASSQDEVTDFLESCPCDTEGRVPLCSPEDITQSVLVALLGLVDILQNNDVRQQALLEQIDLRLEALEDLQLDARLGGLQDQIDARVNGLQDQIDELQGVDRNLTGSGMSAVESIQGLRNDLLVLEGVNFDQNRRLEDLDSQSNIAWALGIVGTVFGSLGLALLISICCCLCCPGNRLPSFASPRPIGPACPPPPLCRPVINGPVYRRPMLPAAGNMARFGVGRMPAGPLYGGYCR